LSPEAVAVAVKQVVVEVVAVYAQEQWRLHRAITTSL
jgi:hypothetical protein